MSKCQYLMLLLNNVSVFRSHVLKQRKIVTVLLVTWILFATFQLIIMVTSMCSSYSKYLVMPGRTWQVFYESVKNTGNVSYLLTRMVWIAFLIYIVEAENLQKKIIYLWQTCILTIYAPVPLVLLEPIKRLKGSSFVRIVDDLNPLLFNAFNLLNVAFKPHF